MESEASDEFDEPAELETFVVPDALDEPAEAAEPEVSVVSVDFDEPEASGDPDVPDDPGESDMLIESVDRDGSKGCSDCMSPAPHPATVSIKQAIIKIQMIRFKTSCVLSLKWGSHTTQNAVPEFRIQESEFRIVVSALRTDKIFLVFVCLIPL